MNNQELLKALENAVTAVRYAPLYAVLDENTNKAVDEAMRALQQRDGER